MHPKSYRQEVQMGVSVGSMQQLIFWSSSGVSTHLSEVAWPESILRSGYKNKSVIKNQRLQYKVPPHRCPLQREIPQLQPESAVDEIGYGDIPGLPSSLLYSFFF